MSRLIITSSVVAALFTLPAFAADGDTVASTGTPRLTITLPVVTIPAKRPAMLPVLYASLAGLQAYDVYSTHQALALGAREANPLMAGVAGSTTGMVVVKTVSTATTIVLAERLWRKNKVAAILTMVAANGVMAAVAAHNARVVQQQMR